MNKNKLNKNFKIKKNNKSFLKLKIINNYIINKYITKFCSTFFELHKLYLY